MDRSTKDLIDELTSREQELKQSSRELLTIGLAVGFEKTTEFVFAADQNRLSKLNGIVRKGGRPIGTIAIVLDGQEVQFLGCLLKEYETKRWATNYLESIMQNMRDGASVSGLAKSAGPMGQPKIEWIN